MEGPDNLADYEMVAARRITAEDMADLMMFEDRVRKPSLEDQIVYWLSDIFFL